MLELSKILNTVFKNSTTIWKMAKRKWTLCVDQFIEFWPVTEAVLGTQILPPVQR